MDMKELGEKIKKISDQKMQQTFVELSESTDAALLTVKTLIAKKIEKNISELMNEVFKEIHIANEKDGVVKDDCK